MPVDLGRLRIERFNVEVTYHAAWTFSGLKGILGETWAHGPVFGAFGELGTGQVNLTPQTTSDDQRITAVAGVRASGLLAEGPLWTPKAPQIAQDWLKDVLELLKPRRIVGMRNEIFGLFPIRSPDIATKRLIKRYFNETEFRRVVGSGDRPAYTSLDVFSPAAGDTPMTSYIVGVVGPPHKGTFFAHEDEARDSAWWMGVRLFQIYSYDTPPEKPLEALASMISATQKEFRRVATATLPTLVE